MHVFDNFLDRYVQTPFYPSGYSFDRFVFSLVSTGLACKLEEGLYQKISRPFFLLCFLRQTILRREIFTPLFSVNFGKRVFDQSRQVEDDPSFVI